MILLLLKIRVRVIRVIRVIRVSETAEARRYGGHADGSYWLGRKRLVLGSGPYLDDNGLCSNSNLLGFIVSKNRSTI